MERKNEAVNLFKKRYGKTPEESGMPEIDIYEKQGAFLYAVSQETIQAYKTQQNILRWILSSFIWPIVIVVLNFFIAIIIYQEVWHPLCLASYIVFVLYLVLLFVLSTKIKKTERLIKLDKTIIYLSYK